MRERSSTVGLLGCGPTVGKVPSPGLQPWEATAEAPGDNKPALKGAEAHSLLGGLGHTVKDAKQGDSAPQKRLWGSVGFVGSPAALASGLEPTETFRLIRSHQLVLSQSWKTDCGAEAGA